MRIGLDSIDVRGIWLHKRGEYVVVEVEIEDHWIEIIAEHVESEFSHICEPSGIKDRLERRNNVGH